MNTFLQPKIFANFKQRTPKPKSREHRKDEDHLAFIRSLPSCLSGDSPCDPHHLLGAGGRGTAQKAEDWWTVPITRREHDRLHKEAVADTEHQWFAEHGCEWVYQLAERLWKLSGDYEAAEAVLRLHRRMG